MKKLCFAVILFINYLIVNQAAALSTPCALKQFKAGYVCVCNTTYCDTLEFDEPSTAGQYVIVSSSKDGLRFRVDDGVFQKTKTGVEPLVMMVSNPQNSNRITDYLDSLTAVKDVILTVDSRQKYQKIVGFGGAFTGAVSHNFDKLDQDLQNKLFKSYYSKTEGIAFNMMRIPIGGSDFDLAPWAYNEQPINDKNLSNFTQLDSRDLRRIEQINSLKSVSQNFDIKLMGAAWSPPPWMKSNNAWTGASRLKTEYYQTWANYHIKYLELMEKSSIKFWAISTGNEPMNGVIGWLFVHFMSLGWTAIDQGKWVGESLGPALRNSKFKDVQLFAGDDQRYTFPWWFTQMDSGHPNATSYVDGLAVHWYWDIWVPALLLSDAHRRFPDKLIMNTEACLGDKPFDVHGPILGSWERGEKYIDNIMQDFKHSVNGWIDWNLILDEIGGPNYVKNYVEAAVIVNTTSGLEAYKQPIFHVLGHFSRFITPDSVRVNVKSNNPSVEAIGFLRTDSKIALVFYNKNTNPIQVTIKDRNRGNILLTIPSKSIHSLLYL